MVSVLYPIKQAAEQSNFITIVLLSLFLGLGSCCDLIHREVANGRTTNKSLFEYFGTDNADSSTPSPG